MGYYYSSSRGCFSVALEPSLSLKIFRLEDEWLPAPSDGEEPARVLGVSTFSSFVGVFSSLSTDDLGVFFLCWSRVEVFFYYLEDEHADFCLLCLFETC